MNKNTKAIIGITIVTLFFVGIAILIGKPLIEFVSNPTQFRQWVNDNGIIAPIAFVGMVVLQVIIAIIPGEPLEIGAGYAFGTIHGTLLTMLGITIGSICIFLAVKRWGMKIVNIFFSQEKIENIKWIHNTKKLYLISIILFAIPGTPKDLITYFAGLTEMKLLPFLLIVNFARLPSIITSTLGGNAIGTKKYGMAAIVFAVTALITIIGIMIYKHINSSNQDK